MTAKAAGRRAEQHPAPGQANLPRR